LEKNLAQYRVDERILKYKLDAYTCHSALVLAKIFQYLFMHQKDNPQKPPAKVLKTKEEVQTTLKNKKKTTTNSPRSAFKRKNKVEEGRV